MRKLTFLSFLIAFVTTGSVWAVQFDLAVFSAESPGNSWLAQVSDRIDRHRTTHSFEACGSPLACSKVVATTLWQCESVAAMPGYAVRATLRLYGKLYYYDGPYRRRKPARDRQVVDAESAVVHEYTQHIIPAIAAATPILDLLQSRRFTSRERCQTAAREASEAVTAAFRHELVKTQKRELLGEPAG